MLWLIVDLSTTRLRGSCTNLGATGALKGYKKGQPNSRLIACRSSSATDQLRRRENFPVERTARVESLVDLERKE